MVTVLNGRRAVLALVSARVWNFGLSCGYFQKLGSPFCGCPYDKSPTTSGLN